MTTVDELGVFDLDHNFLPDDLDDDNLDASIVRSLEQDVRVGRARRFFRFVYFLHARIFLAI
jgi:hypothetical protein